MRVEDYDKKIRMLPHLNITFARGAKSVVIAKRCFFIEAFNNLFAAGTDHHVIVLRELINRIDTTVL